MEHLRCKGTQAVQCFNVSFRGKCARMGNTVMIPSPTKLARLGHFPPVSQASPPCRHGVLCICLFSRLTITPLAAPLVLVCVSQHKWLNVIGQKVPPYLSAITELHLIETEIRAQVRQTCSKIEQYEPHGQNLSSTSGSP
jgi:hypothetical protein